MNLPSWPFPAWLLLLFAGGALGILLLSLSSLYVHRVSLRQLAVALGAGVLVAAAWGLRTGLYDGMSFHLLGAALLTLMCGPALALCVLGLVLCLAMGFGLGDGAALGLNFFLLAVLPVGWVYACLRLAQRYLPANYFVYLFVNAFLAGGASLLLAASAGLALLALFAAYPLQTLWQDALPFYFLLSWSEAFTSGLLTAVLVIYRPQWMTTFDDARYLAR